MHSALLPSHRFMLVADDYGLSAGVSAGIEALAQEGRLSATGAIVTLPDWPSAGASVPDLRNHIAVGLHLNLTLGAPLGAMPSHAPKGEFPPVSDWIARGLTGRIDLEEVEAEITRQLQGFEDATGAPPDLIDGHHHVHALPGMRLAFARAVKRHFKSSPLPLLRVPADKLVRILRRGGSIPKALLLAGLTGRARGVFTKIGAPVNAGFAGFSTFRHDVPFASEFQRFHRAPGPRHLVMCHPGHCDKAAAALDPVSDRRDDELATLMAAPDLPAMILHPAQHRGTEGRIDWGAVYGG